MQRTADPRYRDEIDLSGPHVRQRTSVAERSHRRVADALDRLEADYGEFEKIEKTWTRSPDEYDAVSERFEAGTLGGAGCWTTDDEGRVLFVRHEGETAWSDPGRKQEPGETLEAAARRETREEAGVAVEIAGVRQAHRIEVRDVQDMRDVRGESRGGLEAVSGTTANRDRPPLYRLIVIFDAEYVSGEPSPREGEIAVARWWSARPDELRYEELGGFPIPAAERR